MSYEQRMPHKDNKISKMLFNGIIIVPMAFLVISAHCITRGELHSAFKMLSRKNNTDNSERPKEQAHAGNYSGGELVRNVSVGIVGEPKYTRSSGSIQWREFKKIENP